MKMEEYDYHLPEELIAQTPLTNRTASKLLILDRSNNELKHDVFSKK